MAVRERLYNYLRERPEGATTEELVPVVFHSGANEVAARVVYTLLSEDPRFVVHDPEGRWFLNQADVDSQLLAETAFVVVDLETTSVGRGAEQIIEVAAARVRSGRVIAEVSQLIRPEGSVPPFVVGLTGIDDAMLTDQPTIEEAWPKFHEFLGDDVLVAHNARYDLGFLQAAARRYGGRAIANPVLCTLKLARRLLPDLPRRGLDSLAGHFGVVVRDRHRALGDVRMTVEVLYQMLELLDQRGLKRLGEALALQDQASDGRPFASFLPRDTVSQLPEEPGVYRLYDQHGELLYIGRARNLRERVSSYLSNAVGHREKTLELIRRAHQVRVEVLGTELEASLTEASAIRSERPPFNRLGQHLPRVSFIKLNVAAPLPVLSIATRVGRGRSRYFGPFRDRHEARRIANFLARRFGIRTTPPSIGATTTSTSEPHMSADDMTGASLDAYRTQVWACLQVLEGDSGSLRTELTGERRLHLEEQRCESAIQAERDLALVGILERQSRSYGWVISNPNLLVLQTLRGRSVQVYVVRNGRLAVRDRLHHPDDVVALATRIERLDPVGDEDLAAKIDGMVILAAWLRDRSAREGYVFELQHDHLGRIKVQRPATLQEWRAACASLLGTE